MLQASMAFSVFSHLKDGRFSASCEGAFSWLLIMELLSQGVALKQLKVTAFKVEEPKKVKTNVAKPMVVLKKMCPITKGKKTMIVQKKASPKTQGSKPMIVPKKTIPEPKKYARPKCYAKRFASLDRGK